MIGRRPAAAAEEIDSRSGEGRPVLGEGCGIHVEEGLLPFESGETGIWLGGQRNGGVGFHGLDEGQHGFRAGGAVAADGIGAETLQGDQGRNGIGSVQGTAAVFIGQGDNRKGRAGFLDGQEGRAGLLNVHHGFDDEEIDPAFRQSPDLFRKSGDGFFKGEVAEGFHEMACRADISGDEGPGSGGTPGKAGQFPVDFVNRLRSVLGELEAVRPEGAGIDDIRASLPIGPVNVFQNCGMFQAPQLGADPAGHALFLQLRSRGAIQDEDFLFEQATDCFLGLHEIPFLCRGLRSFSMCFRSVFLACEGRPCQ